APETYLAQRYVDAPYLVGGKKFDLRIYALVTSYSPLRVFLYRSGFARFTNARYSMKKEDITNTFIHLTNVAIQKHAPGFDVAKGMKWSIRSLRAFMTTRHGAEASNELFHNMQVPGLAVVIVGERKDSQTYVRMKKKACEEVGILSFGSDLPESATQAEVLKVVQDLNSNPDVHGILVQLPLPRHMDEEVVLGAISLEKDVDGFHPLNMGSLTMKGREPLFAPCTPLGCIELLKRCGIPIKGQRAVVVGGMLNPLTAP
ncbi:uncharacterized protein HaLaN_12367, partial [Haematococcus lacustris]